MISRRALIAGAFALGAMPRMGLAQASPTPEGLIAAAQARAAAPYRPPSRDLAAPFDALDYDSYRGVRPRPGKAAALPLGGQFRADLLPPGWLFREPVQISLPGHDTRFATDLFSYDPALVALPTPLPDMAGMGFSGLRLHYPLNRADHWDEVLVLQGASYFRALAVDTVYGLSARGFALGTGGAGPEEFPLTEEIHVFSADSAVQFGCLIDRPRAAAAFIATLTPGAVTRMACQLHLFARTQLEDAGIAPLTSMFQHNALGPARIDDFRPAVHDSDVLVMENGAGEVIWRPLANPARLQMSAFADQNPRGFGLLQSPTEFAAFRDAEAAYHRRPSAWITPQGDWGRGAVMLLEIPTENEFADNIVAFWRPEAPLGPGGHVFAYDLEWRAPGGGALPLAPLPLQLAHMASGIEPNLRAGRLFVLDYTGQPPDGGASMQPEFGKLAGAEISGVALYPLEGARDTWRLSFVLTPEPGVDVAELRLRLRSADGTVLAPLWLYRWTRSAGGGV
ncbi:MAG: glucan biosynthesis protein [Roseinatronobacter sp.]|nr:glucan biosynthesis protein [Roseinatronobacter sp.]